MLYIYVEQLDVYCTQHCAAWGVETFEFVNTLIRWPRLGLFPSLFLSKLLDYPILKKLLTECLSFELFRVSSFVKVHYVARATYSGTGMYVVEETLPRTVKFTSMPSHAFVECSSQLSCADSCLLNFTIVEIIQHQHDTINCSFVNH